MKTWQKVSLVTLFVLLICAIRVYFIWRERHEPMVQPHQAAEPQLTQDEMVLPRKMYIDSISDAKALDGKTVWIQAGYSLDYYPYAGHRVDFAHQSGVLPSVQQMEIQDIVTQKVPASHATRVPHGDKQVLVVFKMPNRPDEYATAIGYIQGSDSTFYCDQIFYYDDPHTMYNYWGSKVWAAIDAHHPIPGMNELQTAMALGVVQQSEASTIGNRTVYYDAGPQKWAVTFSNDKATTIKQQ
ncbi:MAG TPA: hypothetical protein VMD58_04180 [Acidobacteriaceae bacterium]|nr:hypothetical protein [Acidobacteriaceae bacterium]